MAALLEREQQIVKPFAWGAFGGIDEKYQVVGIDKDGRLKAVILAKGASGYQVVRSGPHAERQDVLIDHSGSLRLADLQPDEEFPFRSDVLTLEDCEVHFVLSWRALNRSFRKRSFLTGIDVRIIVKKDSKIVSNERAGFSFFGFREPLKKDINRDGKMDYVFVGQDNSNSICIWTLEPDCTVKPILFEFKEEGTPIRERCVSGRELFLKPDKQSGSEDVHIRWSESYVENGRPYWRIAEDVYKWDSRDGVYRKAGVSSWLKRAD
ncbi:MAG: hypothetical protein AABO41_17820 [Acidobacteriota bacterium]